MHFVATPRPLAPRGSRVLIAVAVVLAWALTLAKPASAQAPVVYVKPAGSDGLVGYWPFSENDQFNNTTVTRDASSLPQVLADGQLMNGAAYVQETIPLFTPYNPSLIKLDGADDYITIPATAHTNLVDSFSFAAWVKRTATDGVGTIYASGSDPAQWYVGFAADGRLVFGAGNQVLAASTNALTTDQWNHIVVAKNGAGAGSIVLYVNGAVVGSGAAGALPAPSGAKWVGARPGVLGTALQGAIDDVRLYNRPLTQAEAAHLGRGSGCAGDGSSWANAYTDISCALAEASSNSEAWIMRGLYVPGPISANTFQLRNGLDLYGGFAGTETSRNQRPAFVLPTSTTVDPAQYTVLSGDILGNDDPANFTGYDENATHVIKGSGGLPIRLDGLVVRNGYMNDDPSRVEDNGGAGLINLYGTVLLSNIGFVSNHGVYGGAFLTRGGGVSLNSVAFVGNKAVASGGGAYIAQSDAVLADLTFSGNQAGTSGGGLTLDALKTALNNTTFSGNKAGVNGGGLLLTAMPSVKLAKVTFDGNTAANGAGMAAIGSAGELSTVTVRNNQASGNGGGFYVENSGLTVSATSFTANQAANGAGAFHALGGVAYADVTWEGNNATNDGGALYLQGAVGAQMNRLRMLANAAAGRGGAIFSQGGTNPQSYLYNADMVGNRANLGSAICLAGGGLTAANLDIVSNVAGTAGAVSVIGGANASLKNSVLWANGAGPVHIESGSALATAYNRIEGSAAPEGNDPKFAQLPNPGDGNWGTLGDNNYGNLNASGVDSSLIDAGDNAALPNTIETDLSGNGRRWKVPGVTATGNAAGNPNIVDIGSREYYSSIAAAKITAPETGLEGSPVTLDASGSTVTAGATIASYEWSCDGDNTFEQKLTTPTTTCTFPDNGVFTVRLRVTSRSADGQLGGSNEATAVITIANVPPKITPAAGLGALLNQESTFALGSFTDPGVNDSWKGSVAWGDETSEEIIINEVGSLPAKAHTYKAVGTYNVTVRITDNDGGADSATFQIVVADEATLTTKLYMPTLQKGTAQ